MTFWKSIYTILTLSCDQASFLNSKSQDAPLTRSERIALTVHHKLCRFCRRYTRQLATLREILNTAATRAQEGDMDAPKVSPEQRKRVLDFLDNHLS